MRVTKLYVSLLAATALCALTATSSYAKRAEHGPMWLSLFGVYVEIAPQRAQAIDCSISFDHGEITSATSGTIKLLLTNCKFQRPQGEAQPPCGPETIESGPLGLEVGWISKERGEVGLAFKGVSGPIFSNWPCLESPRHELLGTVIGYNVEPNRVIKYEEEFTFFDGAGYGPASLEGKPEDPLSDDSGAQVFVRSSRLTYEYRNCRRYKFCPLIDGEVNTVVNPVQPEFGRCEFAHKRGRFQDANCTQLVAGKSKTTYEFFPAGS